MILADPIIHIPNAASLYSQISGLLAGFAFTALMVYLTRPAATETAAPERGATVDPSQAARERAVALALLSTLVALVVVAVLYAVLAGGPDESGAGHLGIIVYGTAFALAILSMFHTIGLLASSSEHLRDVRTAARLWTAVVGPTIALVLVSSAALNVFHFRCPPPGTTAQAISMTGYGPPATSSIPCDASSQLSPTEPFGLGIVLSGILLAASVAVFLMAARRPVTNPLRPVVPAVLVVAVALLAAYAAVILLMLPGDFVPTDGLVSATLSAAFLLFLSFSVLTAAPLHPKSSGP